eukprot:CAMPEP_0115307134 /NCGR_PEP_ID=MMETSP0270-20121206/72967_1 /TAXON_ID=71861 /ORGANISM="Scrippsiella trochoidea, Strain CCMP3099" /LENGTH=35 /DNA_ID= /DNA_START= /DNA_END= /DNA_ORIENTATION=
MAWEAGAVFFLLRPRDVSGSSPVPASVVEGVLDEA